MQIDRSIAVAVDCSALSRREIVSFLSADTWATDSLSPTVTTDSITWSSLPQDGKWHAALKALVPGDELTGVLTAGHSTIRRGVVVRHAGGSLYVYTDGVSLAKYTDKVNGVAATTVDFSWRGKSDQPAWQPANVLWTVRIYSKRLIGVMLNGTEVLRRKLSGDIIDAGFGLYGYEASSGKIDYVSLVKREVFAGQAPVNLLIIGDSTSREERGWHQEMVLDLDGYLGARIESVSNRAVGGHTAADQLSALQSAGVGSATHAIVLVGTNDIRAGVSVATYLSNVGAILNICAALGVVVGIPPLFYSTDLGMRQGLVSSNCEDGAPYRAGLQRLVAARGLKLVDLNQMFGPIVTDYIAGSGCHTGDLQAPPMLADNLHWTDKARSLAAKGFGAALADLISPKVG